MRILLVEDDERLAMFLKKGLKETGYAVDWFSDGIDGEHFALTEPYDLLLIDIMLPSKSGLQIIKKVRTINTTVPILILSAKRSVEEKIEGLDVGSDDYLTKPFALVELLARVRALLRRSSLSPKENNYTVTAGDVEINSLKREVLRKGHRVDLLPKEFLILEYLMQNAGHVVTRTMLMEHVWDFQFDPSTNIIDVHVCNLRSKIDKGDANKRIKTIRGVGYVFEAKN